MLILPTYSPVRVMNGACQIDRKFHTGACLYVELLPIDIVVLAPKAGSSDKMMDSVTIPIDELPYKVEAISCDANYQLDDNERSKVEGLVKDSTIIYGIGFGVEAIAHRFEKPFIPILEYNLSTQLQMARISVSGILRKSVRSLKTIWRFLLEVQRIRKARSIHCNGYPIFEQSSKFHQDCLLYLDSRMYEKLVISEQQIKERLSEFSARRPRLFYSGRYEAIKGAVDVVEVGLELRRNGIQFDLNLYGKGSQANEMRKRVRQVGAEEIIQVHDAVPYPELVKLMYSSDLFICCHVQDDPSCSYIEAFGAGLAVAGYDNRMWRSLSRESKTGIVTPMNNPKELAREVASLLSDKHRLESYSLTARNFALIHCFEREFSKRIESLLPLCSGEKLPKKCS